MQKMILYTHPDEDIEKISTVQDIFDYLKSRG
jgi:acyl carrier protein